MTQEEFQNLTGIKVDFDEFDAIEQLYYAERNMGKDAFCEWFKQAASSANGYAILTAAGRELLQSERFRKVVKQEREELAFFVAEQAEKCSSAELREKAIEMLGEKKYICWKLNGKRSLWQLDIDLIKKLIDQ